MQATLTRGYCRGEQRESTFRFAGYATASASENHVRPRAFYQACSTASCSTTVLTLGNVPDALGLCLAVLDENLLAHGARGADLLSGAPFDTDNVLGELFLYVWRLYNAWNPARGVDFCGYAFGILRQRVKTFVAHDRGEPTGSRVHPRAHGRSVSVSLDAFTDEADGVGDGGSWHGVGQVDPTQDRAFDTCWLLGVGDR